MVQTISGSLGMKQGFVVAQPLSVKALRSEILKQKMADLRTRMGICDKQVAKVEREQTEMEQTAVVIEHDQMEIRREQERLQQRQLVLAQDTLQIKANHAQIKQEGSMMELMWNALVYCAFDIYSNQRKVKKDLAAIDQQRQHIHQQATVIHQNACVIKQTLQVVRLKVPVIEAKVVKIQDHHAAMDKSVLDIETKRDYIRDHIPLLLPQTDDIFTKKSLPFIKEKKIVHAEAEGLLKKIQNFCLCLLAFIWEGVRQVYHMLYTDFSLKHAKMASLISAVAIAATTFLKHNFLYTQG